MICTVALNVEKTIVLLWVVYIHSSSKKEKRNAHFALQVIHTESLAKKKESFGGLEGVEKMIELIIFHGMRAIWAVMVIGAVTGVILAMAMDYWDKRE